MCHTACVTTFGGKVNIFFNRGINTKSKWPKIHTLRKSTATHPHIEIYQLSTIDPFLHRLHQTVLQQSKEILQFTHSFPFTNSPNKSNHESSHHHPQTHRHLLPTWIDPFHGLRQGDSIWRRRTCSYVTGG